MGVVAGEREGAGADFAQGPLYPWGGVVVEFLKNTGESLGAIQIAHREITSGVNNYSSPASQRAD
jgi:hypothetical protein